MTALLLLSCGPKRPAEDPPRLPHARLELLHSQSDWLGVHFVMDTGWHIYWENPGDSGQPPVIAWRLPQGFSAGVIHWPTPERLNSTGGSLKDYGYKGQVLLLARLQGPGTAPKDAVVEATVKYLICREVCLPEKAELRLPLADAAENESLFETGLKRIPQPWPKQWQAKAISEKDDFSVELDIGNSLRKIDFFPLDPEQIDNAAPQRLQPTARGARIVLKKSDQLLKPITVLRGVLVLPEENASYRVDIPVTQR